MKGHPKMSDDKEQGGCALADYATLTEWLDHDAGPFFPTRSGVEWFIKMNRPELVSSGALIPRAGRAGSLVHRTMFPKLVIAIHRRMAERRISGNSGVESA